MSDFDGNGRNMHNFQIHLGDALMLMEAMRLSGNAAMMCSQPDAEKRLREYQARFDALVPTPARIFDGEIWAEINMSLATAPHFEAFIDKGRSSSWYSKTGRMVIKIGDKQWHSKSYQIEESGAEFVAVIAVLEELAPIDCKRLIPAE